MSILARPLPRVKFDSRDVARPVAFGEGILPDVSRLARRGPTSVDRAWKNGLDVALECEGPVEAPSGYTEAERSAFLLGLMEGARLAHEREAEHLDDLAMQAEAEELMGAGTPWL